MAKLWAKDYDLDTTMEAFTVGKDYVLDMELVEADVLGNLAHVAMLEKIGVVTADERKRAKKALLEVLEEYHKGAFSIARSDEDVHTAVEGAVTAKAGDVGKKIHTARSRNDQVIVDTRIYGRDRLLDVMGTTLSMAGALLDFAEKNKDVPYPGRTHTQVAMPSSVALWAGAFAEALLDDYRLLEVAYDLNNQNPLGSAASYGVAVPIDREYTTQLLGFAKPINNVLYANNSRGKFEQTIIFACSQVMLDLAKLANDTILFAIPEFGYFKLPAKYCPGSSIMPQKKNPCQLELTRSKASGVVAALLEVMMIGKGLYSGYNRDLQDTKEPLMKSLTVTRDTLIVNRMIFETLEVDAEAAKRGFTPDIFAADVALRMATSQGIPFRDAYKKVGLNIGALESQDPVENIRSKTHLGAPGNLGLDKDRAWLKSCADKLAAEAQRVAQVKSRLLEK
jgi:argininosuccinate lyase